MSQSDINQLLDALLREVKSSPPDDATIRQLREFESALEPYLTAYPDNTDTQPGESDDTGESLLDKANRLEVAFAQRHPVAEGITREIINTLSRMGI